MFIQIPEYEMPTLSEVADCDFVMRKPKLTEPLWSDSIMADPFRN